MDPAVSPAAYARAGVAALAGGRPAPPPPAGELYQTLAACFVSIKTRSGDLRGCIGTLSPSEARLGDEIARNAYAAAFSDPRFYPVRPAELGALTYSVDVLSDSEPTTVEGLDPVRFGVIVSCGHRRGVLLPDLPTVTTAGQQVGIALQKAGISPSEDYALARFTVRRFRETEGGDVRACRSDETVPEGEVTCVSEDETQKSTGEAGAPAGEAPGAAGETTGPTEPASEASASAGGAAGPAR
jgi:AmmeMemoRadiSam system protein A